MKRKASTQITKPKPKLQRQNSFVVNIPKALAPQKSNTFSPELKSYDTHGSFLIAHDGYAGPSHVSLINCPIKGSEMYNRIGRRIKCVQADINITLYPGMPTPDTLAQNITFICFVDSDPTTSTLPGYDLLYKDFVGPTGAPLVDIMSHRNLDLIKRFRVLRRKNIPLRTCGTATGVIPCNGNAFQASENDITFSWSLPLNLETQFNSGNGGTITDMVNNALYIGYWTDAQAPQQEASFKMSTRVRYRD